MRFLLAPTFALAVAACASTAPPPRAVVTTTAAVVAPPSRAALVDPLTAAVTASLAGDDARALAILDRRPSSAWRDYERGVALAALRRPDDAAGAFDAAARAFPEDDVRDRAIAIFGKARAYEDTYHCAEAARAYREYAALVGATDPASAHQAESEARACKRVYAVP